MSAQTKCKQQHEQQECSIQQYTIVDPLQTPFLAEPGFSTRKIYWKFTFYRNLRKWV